MADIKRTISLQYQAEGLEKIKKTLEGLVPGDSNKELFGNLTREIKEIETILKKSSDGLFDEGTAEQLQKRYEKALGLFEKYRISVVKLQNEILGAESEDLERRYQQNKARLENIEDEKVRLEKEITELQSGEIRATQVQRKGALDSVKGQVLGSGEGARKMYSAKGREMTDAFAFVKNFQIVESVFDKANQAEAELLEKLKEGKDLSEADAILLQQKLDTNNSIKLNAEEVIEQAKIRKELLDAEQAKLLEIKETRLDTLEKEKFEIEGQVIGYRELKKESQEDFAQGGEDEEELEIIEKTNEALELFISLTAQSDKERANLRKKIKESIQAEKEEEEAIKKTNTALKDKDNTLGKAIKNVVSYGSAYAIVRRIYKETISTIKEMDNALTNMTVVTSMSREQAWKLVGTFQDLARQTGFTTTEIANLATEYFRQGKTLEDVIELTEVAAKAARIAGISAQESMNYLTSALNGFQIAAEDAMAVSDKFAALAASSASDYEELAVGLSKFAAQAKVAGISIDFALAMLTKGVSVTREAPETIGTAIKTVLSRMRELTDFGATLEDGMDVNRVEKALGYIGVALRDANGQFRDMEQVLTEVGMQWDTLNATQQASVAVALAGTRQQSRLIAIMSDFQTTLDYVETSQDSAGATAYQHAQYMKGLEVAMTNLTTAWQGFTMALADSEVVIFVVNLISGALDLLVKALEALGPVVKGLVIVVGAGIIVQKIYSTVLKMNIKETYAAIKAKLGLAAAEELGTKASLKNILVEKIGIAGIWMAVAADSIKAFWLKIKTKLTKDNTKANIANAASMSLGTAAANLFAGAMSLLNAVFFASPIGLIAAILIGITVAIIAAATASKRWAKQVEKAAAEMYKLQKINKELEDTSEKITEINNKPIKIKTDLEELDRLLERLEEIEQQEDVKLVSRNLITGEVDWEKTQENIDAYEEKNKKERLKKAKEIAEVNKKRFKKGDIGAEEYGESLATKYVLENDLEVDQAQIDALNKLYAQAVKDGRKISDEQAKLFLDQVAEFEKAMADTEGDIVKQLQIWENLPKGMKEQFEIAYPELAKFFGDGGELIKKYSGAINGLGLSAEELANLAAEAQKAGISSEELFDRIEEAYEETGDWDMALARVAKTTEDVTLKNYLYAASMKESMLSITQSAEKVVNAITRIDKAQEDLLAGNLSDSDFVELVDEYQDIFNNPELFEAFMRGDNVSEIVKAAEKEKIYKDYEKQLYAINSQLEEYGENLSEEEEQQKALLIAEKNKVSALLAMRNPLRNITYEQNKYNEALKRYQNLQALGFENIKDQELLLEMLQKTLYGSFKSNTQSLDFYEEKLNAIAPGLYEIKDGVVVLKSAFYDLEPAIQETAYSLIQSLQGALDNQLEYFKEWSGQVLQLEEKRVAEQKKIYEDYFKALDKLEEKRDKKLTRDSIIKQLQRLEGATDERSRQKALELRKELNALDEETSKSEIEAAREALLGGLDNQIDALKETLRDMWIDFQAEVAKGGQNLGLAFLEILQKYGFGDHSGSAVLVGQREDLEDRISALQKRISKLVAEVRSRTTSGINEQGKEISGDYKFWSGIFQENEKAKSQATTEMEALLNERKYTYGGQLYSLAELQEKWKNLGDNTKYTASGGTGTFEGFLDYAVESGSNKPATEEYERVKQLGTWIEGYSFQIEQASDILRKYNETIDQENAVLQKEWTDLVAQLKEIVKAINELNYGEEVPFPEEPTTEGPPPTQPGTPARPIFEISYTKSPTGEVDYSRLGRVLRTKVTPESVLTIDQFARLVRLETEKAAEGGNNVNIENITIQTNELNNAQDFSKAGQALAAEFQKAITRRGIGINTKR